MVSYLRSRKPENTLLTFLKVQVHYLYIFLSFVFLVFNIVKSWHKYRNATYLYGGHIKSAGFLVFLLSHSFSLTTLVGGQNFEWHYSAILQYDEDDLWHPLLLKLRRMCAHIGVFEYLIDLTAVLCGM